MTKTKTPAKKPARKTLSDFATAHDKNVIVPAKIEAGFEKLGKDGWEYEAEFLKLAGVSVTDFSRFRDRFTDHSVMFKDNGRDRRVWAGTPALANKIREMV